MYSAAENGQYGTDEYEGQGFGTSFSTKAIRLAFIRKVYGILSVQLIISLGFICVFAIPEGMRQWSHQNLWVVWVAFGVTLVTMMVLACCGELRRQTPHNYIALMIFTVAESFLLGVISSIYQYQIVLAAVGITAVVCLALTLFAFQTKIDFTVYNGILFVGVIILMLFGFVLMFWRSQVAHLVYSCLGALLFSAYLVVDTQMIVGGTHNVQVSSEEYIFAALTLYIDIVQLFLHILNIIASSSRN
ncbi:protein lifeguard 1-like isoform X2 [Oppia nitens]|uniref:protein lifeguard 1-like isoform X2 n=1 Tax=Oppia nitens TaxID=1686743 RepID=UPI0023DB1048|nr:protein lifeguard 1-like isoform X2 [Oppia nitens]